MGATIMIYKKNSYLRLIKKFIVKEPDYLKRLCKLTSLVVDALKM